MRSEVQKRLLSLNREFYQTFAVPFAESRPRPQPGIPRILPEVQSDDPVLDLGCGNGSLAEALFEQGHRGPYVGLDNSPALLDWARDHSRHPHAEFILGDLAGPDWAAGLDRRRYPWIFALAVLHHLPGAERRQRFARVLQSLIGNEGTVVISVWNFPAETRWRERIIPWSTVGLSEKEVEGGDTLLDWRRGGRGLRYVHHFKPGELERLASTAGCQVVGDYRAGGDSGELNWIQRWQPV